MHINTPECYSVDVIDNQAFTFLVIIKRAHNVRFLLKSGVFGIVIAQRQCFQILKPKITLLDQAVTTCTRQKVQLQFVFRILCGRGENIISSGVVTIDLLTNRRRDSEVFT